MIVFGNEPDDISISNDYNDVSVINNFIMEMKQNFASLFIQPSCFNCIFRKSNIFTFMKIECQAQTHQLNNISFCCTIKLYIFFRSMREMCNFTSLKRWKYNISLCHTTHPIIINICCSSQFHFSLHERTFFLVYH